MKLNEEIFAIKLYELEEQFGKMQGRLHLCQQQDHSKIKQHLQDTMDEYQENEYLLKKQVQGSHSSIVASLADAQQEYLRKTSEILKDQMASQPVLEEKAEASALYAEYAIDFAVQSMRYALIAALKAIDMQIDAEENALNKLQEKEEHV